MRFRGDLVSASIVAFCYLLKLFHLASFINFPLRLDPRTGVEIGERCWLSFVCWLLHCLFTVVCCTLARYDYNCLYAGLELTGTMNNYFRFVMGMATAFASLGDSFCCLRRHRSIWRCYRRLAEGNGVYLGLLDRVGAVSFMRGIMAMFVLLVTTCAAIQYKAFFTLLPGTQWQCVWIYNMYPISVSYLRHVYHILHIRLMSGNLRRLQGKLDRLRGQVDGQTITVNPRKHEAAVQVTLHDFEACRSIYTDLWHTNEAINELFGFSQALNVACSFVQIGFDLYWVRAMIISGEPHLDLQLLFLFPTPLIVGFLMHSTRNYHLVVRSVRQAVLDMPCMHDDRLVQLRGHFLDQLQRLPFRLTARNVFEFDITLLPKLVFVIVTYLIVFVEINR